MGPAWLRTAALLPCFAGTLGSEQPLGTALGQLLKTHTPHWAEPPSPKKTLLLKSYCWQCPHHGDPHPSLPAPSHPLTSSEMR